MKALSIMQPFAWLIVEGHKPVENRDWKSWNPGLKYRGEVLIHAGQKFYPGFDVTDMEEMLRLQYGEQTPQFPRIEDMKRGGIVGIAEIVDVVTKHDSVWFNGPYAFVLKNARPLPFMPCRGQLGFFEVDYKESDNAVSN